MSRFRILFVCGRNRSRSPTAEKVYRTDPRVQVRSAGLSPQSSHRISAEDLSWADLVMVMERRHKSRIRNAFPDLPHHPRIVSLDIPDDYEFMDEELVQLINDGVEFYLGGALSNGDPA
jgi:predicted protein tyrosine phosphatase